MAQVLAKQSPAPSYEVEAYSSFDFLGDEYGTLFTSAKATAFQSPYWLHTFYETLCPAVDAEPLIITVREPGSGELVIVMPMVRKSVSFAKILQPADLGITDYNQPIVHPTLFEELVEDKELKSDLFDALHPFDLLLFRKVRSDSLDISRLFDGAVKIPGDSAAHDLPMHGTMDDWRQTLSKSTRKGLGRKKRSVEKDIGPFTLRTLLDEKEIEAAFEMLRLERGKKYPDDLLSKQAYYDFYLKIAKEKAASGEAVTIVGEINGNMVTVDFGLCQNGRHMFILGALDSTDEFSKYSLGILAMVDIMESRKALGIEMFDYTTGDEDYKATFRTIPVPMHHYMVSNGPVGRLGQLAYQDNSVLRKVVQRLFPNLK